MSATLITHDARRIEAFYQRWSSNIFIFCRLFLGDKKEAERIVSRTFLAFYRDASELPLAGGIPVRLIGFAYQVMQPCRSGPARPFGGALEDCLAHLDCRERAAFIARNVLSMAWPDVATAIGVSVKEAQKLWLTGMLRVRDLVPRDFFKS